MSEGSYRKVNVVCPFYRRDEGRKLTCEGLLNGTILSSTFRKEAKMVAHMDKDCCSMDYEKLCPIAAALMKKYE